MAGRAGRRGLDPIGTVILLCKADVPEASDLSRMILGQPTSLESQFRLTYSMLLNLLRVETLRVEDMLKRSFAETESTKHEVDRQDTMIQLQSKLSQLVVSCSLCSLDIAPYYSYCDRVHTLDQQMRSVLLGSPIYWKLLTPGRVVTIHSPLYGLTLGLLLQVTNKQQQTITIITLCEPVVDDNISTDTLFSGTPHSLLVTPHIDQGHLYTPTDLSHTVVTVTANQIIDVTSIMLKIDSKTILNEFRSRLIPRFR